MKILLHQHLLLLTVLSLAIYLPFTGKAFHIDSPVTIYIAEQSLQNILNPPIGDYGKQLSPWNHTGLPEESAYHATPHPPFVPLYTALAIKLFGKSERAVNSTFFIFYLGAVLFFYGLCRRLGLKHYFAATLLFLVSPALVVNAQNIMIDVPLTTLVLGCFFFMFRSDRSHHALWAGVFAGLACLAKFTAGTVVIAGCFYYVLSGRWRSLLFFLLPAVACNAAWFLHNMIYFGCWQLTSNGHAHFLLGDVRYRAERIIAFIGGGFTLPLFALYIWWKSNRYRLIGALIGLAVFVWSALLIAKLHYSPESAFFYWLCASVGSLLIVKLVTAAHPTNVTSTPQLQALTLHTLLQMAGGPFLTLYAVRYTLPFIFVFIIITAIGAEQYLAKSEQKYFWRITIAATLLLTILLSVSDYQIAGAEQRIAQDIKIRYPEKTCFFKGRLGYLYYMYNAGFKSLIETPLKPKPGDLVIKNCFYNDETDYFTKHENKLVKIDALTYRLTALRTIGGRAGFYGNDRIPYAFFNGKQERVFEVYRVIE